MNFVNSQANNYLFTLFENEDKLEDFVKIATTLIIEKKIVLLFTRNHVDFLPLLAGLSKSQMQNFIISYHSHLDGIIQKLLELHDWKILPDLVILNLNSYFDVMKEEPPFEKICFCISALFSYIRSVEIQKGMKGRDVAQCSPKSVSLLNCHRDMQKQIQLLIDFYFYKGASFSEVNEIKSNIFN